MKGFWKQYFLKIRHSILRKLSIIILSTLMILVPSLSSLATLSSQEDRYRVIQDSSNSGGGAGAENSRSGESGNSGNPGQTINYGNSDVRYNFGNSTRPVTSGIRVRLSDKRIKLVTGQKKYLFLDIATESFITWWSTSDVVKLIKEGNGVCIKYRKPGQCYVKAKYSGKVFSCKVICKKGVLDNVMKIRYCTKFTDDKDYKEPIELDCTSEYDDDCVLKVWLRGTWGACKGCKFDYRIEDPTIVTCDWGAGVYNMYGEGDVVKNLFIGGLRPGSTRIMITNNYNHEKKYVTINVIRSCGTPMIEYTPGYNPIASDERAFYDRNL